MVSQRRFYRGEKNKYQERLVKRFLALVLAICLNEWNIEFSLQPRNATYRQAFLFHEFRLH